MESDLKKTLKLKIRQPNLKSLRDLSNKLKNSQRRTFVVRFGKLLNLLEVTVQEGALTALAQFYDPPLRCFTFQDFQLAPTIEEFEQILDIPLGNKKPYLYMGHYPSLATTAATLGIGVRALASKKKMKGGVEGFSRAYLEGYALCLAENEKWDGFMDVLALIIYGIVLFPNIEDFIDFAAIDVFLAYKHERRSLIPTILADTYHTLNLHHERKGGMFLCCLPTLYLWFMTHMFKKGRQIETISKSEPAHNIASLSEKTIVGYSCEQDIREGICQCGDFPNVPLMGTKGCINYNSTLVIRQFGYPIRIPPTEDSITPFIVYEMSKDLDMLNRIRRAWDRVIKKGRELGKRSYTVEGSYHQWLCERVKKVKLPFRSSVPVIEETTIQDPMSLEEIEELKKELEKSKNEKEALKKELIQTRQEHKASQEEITKVKKYLELANKRARIEEECKLNTRSCLEVAATELKLRRGERDEARVNSEQWREAWKKSKEAERNAQRQPEDLKQQLKRVVVEYESRVQDEK
ncbi:uncharacterized protein LOC109793476 [Cajanus cajan]|uniref:uncharacterized protein LOC109793476 n=1 Tax=Cajanus cajan TaxID=3821 RepID=UPI00098D7B8B|nr:uncharacterized protein LOC109793476 [Cajanus cajan]